MYIRGSVREARYDVRMYDTYLNLTWNQVAGACGGLFFVVMVFCLIAFVVIRFRQTQPQKRKR